LSIVVHLYKEIGFVHRVLAASAGRWCWGIYSWWLNEPIISRARFVIFWARHPAPKCYFFPSFRPEHVRSHRWEKSI